MSGHADLLATDTETEEELEEEEEEEEENKASEQSAAISAVSVCDKREALRVAGHAASLVCSDHASRHRRIASNSWKVLCKE